MLNRSNLGCVQYAVYLMNYWVDFNQICIDITFGQGEELIRLNDICFLKKKTSLVQIVITTSFFFSIWNICTKRVDCTLCSRWKITVSYTFFCYFV